MDLHLNARSCPRSRLLMVERREAGWTLRAIAHAAGTSAKTVRKWLRRFEAEGAEGLFDRSSRPHHSPLQTPPEVQREVLALRRKRLTGRQIASELGLPPSTVGRILRRAGVGRLRLLEPPVPVVRYERDSPGELLHVDIKKLGRFWKVGHRATGRSAGLNRSRHAGWEFLHVCVDDHSRVAYVEVLADEKKETATAFIQRAIAWFNDQGVVVFRVMTDNGSCYRSKLFGAALAELGVKHLRTKPYTPQTNGKAERFIQTLLREWAYAVVYASSDDRAAVLPAWLDSYNRTRPHSAIGYLPPFSRLRPLSRNNVLRNHN